MTAACRLVPVVLIALLATGCASTKLPPPDLSAPRLAVAEAEQAGASEVAPLELRSARQKLEQAEQAAEEDDYREARFFAEKALVDAELAEAKARSATAQAAVDELRESIRVLREEIERNLRSR